MTALLTTLAIVIGALAVGWWIDRAGTPDVIRHGGGYWDPSADLPLQPLTTEPPDVPTGPSAIPTVRFPLDEEAQ